MEGEKKLIGEVDHYYSNINVVVIELTDSLKVGDEISIEGETTNFTQKVESMQIQHESIKEAKAGDAIGLKIKEKAREGDSVYKVLK
jgi:putative protease